MGRSAYKGPYGNEKILRKVKNMGQDGRRVIRVWDRACMIFPEMVGFTFAVHNGKEHIPVFVSEAMVGHRLGEFAPTRRFRGHPNKKSS